MDAAFPPADEATGFRAVETRRNLRRSRQTRAKFWHVAIVFLFFVVGLGASLFLGAVMVIGAVRGNGGLSALTADGRTARIARSLQDGKSCHYILFDNKTAQAVEDRIGRCDEGKPKPKKVTPAAFSWGR